MNKKYLFIGGPMHLNAKETNGSCVYYFHRVKQFSITEIIDSSYLPETITDLYHLKRIDILGKIQHIYIHSDMSEYQVKTKLGGLVNFLLENYIQS
jgi:hypothetical protein